MDTPFIRPLCVSVCVCVYGGGGTLYFWCWIKTSKYVNTTHLRCKMRKIGQNLSQTYRLNIIKPERQKLELMSAVGVKSILNVDT